MHVEQHPVDARFHAHQGDPKHRSGGQVEIRARLRLQVVGGGGGALCWRQLAQVVVIDGAVDDGRDDLGSDAVEFAITGPQHLVALH
ncbi:hypothetical protein D3C87_578070 [compost metagenome]